MLHIIVIGLLLIDEDLPYIPAMVMCVPLHVKAYAALFLWWSV